MVYVLAFATGCVTLMDVPARQAFVTEMVGPAEIPNAVALNGAVFNAGRLVGPATAALLIATWGLAPAFFFNGVSYLAVIAGLALMNTSELQRTARAPRGRGQVREGLRFVWRDPELRHTMILIAIVTTFGMNFTVVLPLLSKFTFGGGAGIYGLLTSIMAAGALVGALIAAAAGRSSMRPMLFTAFGFAIAALGAAVAPNIPVEAIVLVPVGAMSIAFIAIANSALQLRAPARMRGRVMALYSLVFLGGNAIGSPIAGGISQVFGARWGLGMAGLTSLAVSIAIAMVHRPLRTARVETAQVAAAIAVAEPDAVRSA
jgi:MFS family permease